MNIETRLRNAKLFYDQIDPPDIHRFKKNVFDLLDKNRKSSKKRLWKTKFVIGLGAIVIPITGYAMIYYVTWSGAVFEPTQAIVAPVSRAATPGILDKLLDQPGVKFLSLLNSKSRATFPIREPVKITGWTKIFSEGYEEPYYHYTVDKSHKLKLVNVTDTPITYTDIYVDKISQRIAVSQHENITLSMVSPSKNISPMNHGVTIGQNETPVQNFFKDSQAYIILGNWSELPKDKLRGSFENLIIYHAESGEKITEIDIDEYGNVSPIELEKFGQAYLESK